MYQVRETRVLAFVFDRAAVRKFKRVGELESL